MEGHCSVKASNPWKLLHAQIPWSKALTRSDRSSFLFCTRPWSDKNNLSTCVNTSVLRHSFRYNPHNTLNKYPPIKPDLMCGGGIKLLQCRQPWPCALHYKTEYKQPANAQSRAVYQWHARSLWSLYSSLFYVFSSLILQKKRGQLCVPR